MAYSLTLNDLDFINKLARYYTSYLRANGFFVEYEEIQSELNLIAVSSLRSFDPQKAHFRTYFNKVAYNYIMKKKDLIIKTI